MRAKILLKKALFSSVKNKYKNKYVVLAILIHTVQITFPFSLTAVFSFNFISLLTSYFPPFTELNRDDFLHKGK